MLRRVLAIVWCGCAVSAAPLLAADQPTGGIIVGANLTSARLSGADATGVTSAIKGGLFVGGFAFLPLTDVVAIEPEVAYAQRHFTVTDTLSSFTATEQWDWVQVPVLAHVTFWRTGNRSVYAIVGPGFGFLARAHEDAAGTSSDVKDDVKRLDVSVIAGAGVMFGRLGVEARYDAGLSDLNRDNGLGDTLSVKDRTITVLATWRFR